MNVGWAQTTTSRRNVQPIPIMSTTETVNFKAYHEDEIRRLTVDLDVSINYDYLCAKLGHVFPSLKRDNFQLAWTDNEGDEIRISSSEELEIA
jgi:PB1 domain.